MVFRTRNGLSIMAKPPKKTLKDANESQLATRRKFKMASRWAKDALQNPATLAEYTAMASGMKSPYVMAVTNYLCPPKINGINVSRYAGEAGNKIEVLAIDDFKLKCVSVKITDATGTLIEEGPCPVPAGASLTRDVSWIMWMKYRSAFATKNSKTLNLEFNSWDIYSSYIQTDYPGISSSHT
jgi:hypothetical protein